MVMMPIKNHIEMGIDEEDMIVSKVKESGRTMQNYVQAMHLDQKKLL